MFATLVAVLASSTPRNLVISSGGRPSAPLQRKVDNQLPMMRREAEPSVSIHASSFISSRVRHGNTTNRTGGSCPECFVLNNGSVKDIKQQVQTISPDEWPASFCVNMNFRVPQIDTEENFRCIALLGGHNTCGSFYLFLSDDNEVGMGVRCETGASGNKSHDDGPLLNEGEGLETNKTYFLQFCYNTGTQEASIWQDKQLAVSSQKKWEFERTGFVSVFVGSHNPKSMSEALYEEDKAELLDLYFSNGPTTTTTTTTTKWFNRTHEDKVVNTTESVDNVTLVSHDEVTTVKTTVDTVTTVQKHIIKIPGANQTAQGTADASKTVTGR